MMTNVLLRSYFKQKDIIGGGVSSLNAVNFEYLRSDDFPMNPD